MRQSTKFDNCSLRQPKRSGFKPLLGLALCVFALSCTGVASNSDSVEHSESGLTCLPPAPKSPFEDSEPIPPPEPSKCNPPMDNPGGTNGTRGVRQ